MIQALAESAELVHDDAACPPIRGMPHKLKNNQQAQGIAIEH
jgi:hypothetical protein